MYAGLGFIVDQFRSAYGERAFNALLALDMVNGMMAIAAAAFLMIVVGWILILASYKGAVLDGRRGRWSFNPEDVNILNASKFIGYQTIHSMVGFLALLTTMTVVVLVLALFASWAIITVLTQYTYLMVFFAGTSAYDYRNSVHTRRRDG